MRSKIAEGRGRPPKPWLSYYDKRAFAYIVGISQKYEINPDMLFKKMGIASENEKSTYKTLKIQCRGRIENYTAFRITKRDKLVTQLRIPNYFLTKGFFKSASFYPAISLET